MGEPVKMLTSHEAAVLAGVRERDMHRAIDESIVPDYLVHVSGKRRGFTPAACVLMAYYVDLSEKLTGRERKRVISEAAPKVHEVFSEEEDTSPGFAIHFMGIVSTGDDEWPEGLRPYVNRVRERLPRLEKARNLVHITPSILDGTPVVQGTRIPVHAVAATYDEEGAEGAIDAYPDLDRETVELAKLYADTHPLRGRPRTRAIPEGARKVGTWRMKRSDVRARAGDRS